MCYLIGRKESPSQWFANDSVDKRKLCPLKFSTSIEDYLSYFSTLVIFVLVYHLNLTFWAKECNRFDDKWYVYQKKKRRQRRVIRKEKDMMRKMKKKKRTKMTSFPAPGIEPWPRTATWCGQMLYPLSCGELVCMEAWILKLCFRCLTYCKDQAYKHMRYSIGQKIISFAMFCNWPN